MAIKPLHEEEVMFEQMVAGFDEALVTARLAEKFTPPSAEKMEYRADRVWLPVAPIAAAYDGFDQSSNFGDITQLSVPVSVGYHKSVNFSATAKQMRNQYALNKYADAARQQLSTQIDLAGFSTAANLGGLFVRRTVAPTGYDDLAEADARMTEIGVPTDNRVAVIAPRTMNAMAGNIAKPQTTASAKAQSAYEKAMVSSDIAGFEVFKNDNNIRLTAATGGTTTVNGANQYYVPKAQNTAAGGETSNVDNRYQNLTVSAGTYANVKVGDAFTIAGVFACHLVTKQSTGQLQTFRVVGKPSSGVIQITPPIISGTGGTKAELEYQNCTAAPADGAAITWLNTTAAEQSIFFRRESLLLIPGTYAVEPDDGWLVMRATTDLGIAITYVRQGNVNDLSVKGRWDIDFGWALTQPQMAGTMVFSQS